MSLTISKDYTFGVEIEYVGAEWSKVYNTVKKETPSWNLSHDISLRLDGYSYNRDDEIMTGEVISPILTNNKKNIKELSMVLEILKSLGACVNNSCGGHIHFGIKPFYNVESISKLLLVWNQYQDVIYRFSTGKYKMYRSELMNYACPIIIYRNLIDLINENNIEKLIIDATRIPNGYTSYSINFCNFLEHGKKHKETIEFRPFAGTLDIQTWLNNINMIGHLLESLSKFELDKLIDDAEFYESHVLEELKPITSKEKQKVLDFSNLLFDNDIDKNNFINQTLNKTRIY